jgi:hypothetical protein
MIQDTRAKQKAESGVIDELTSKFTGLVTATGAVSLAMAAFKFGMTAFTEDRKNAAALSTEMGERKKQLGRDAAITGLSSADLVKAQQPGKYTTVQENEEFIHQVAATQASKPFGVPKVTPKEINDALDLFKETGNKNLSSVFGLPNATPGSVNQLLAMQLAKDSGKIGDLSNAKENYLNRIPSESKDEMVLQAQLSGVADRPAKNRYQEGKKDRIGQTFREYQSNSSLEGRISSMWENITDWMGGARVNRLDDMHNGNNLLPISNKELNDKANQVHELQNIKKLLERANKPRPSTGRVGDHP